MRSLILNTNPEDDPSSSVLTAYCPFPYSAWSTAEYKTVIPINCAIKGLYVESTQAPGVGKSWVYTVMKNSVATSVEAIMSGASLVANNISGVANFVAGDLLSIRAVPVNTPSTAIILRAALIAEAGANESLLIGTNTMGAVAGQTLYFQLFDNISSGTESEVATVIPANGTISNLYCTSDPAPGVGASRAFTVFKNGVAQTLTATISDANTSSNDLVNSFSVVAGDTMSIRIVASTPTAPASARLSHGVKFAPTIDGESILSFKSGSVLSASADRYLTAYGGLAPSTTEANRLLIANECVLKKMYVKLSGSPGVGKNYTISLRKSGITEALSTIIADAASSGNDLINSINVAAGEDICWISTPSGTPTARGASVSCVAEVAEIVSSASFLTTRSKFWGA